MQEISWRVLLASQDYYPRTSATTFLLLLLLVYPREKTVSNSDSDKPLMTFVYY